MRQRYKQRVLETVDRSRDHRLYEEKKEVWGSYKSLSRNIPNRERQRREHRPHRTRTILSN